MKRDEQEQLRSFSKMNLKRKPKEEVLEWSPTGYGFVSAIQQKDADVESEDYELERMK